MYKSIIIVIVIIIATLVAVNVSHEDEPANLKLEQLKQKYAFKAVPSVDHHKLDVLHKKFETPQEVTETCLTCHTETHKEVMASSHWNWDRLSYVKGKGVYASGKKNVLNNFCIGANSNEKSCAKCHIGFGMDSNHYDFTNANEVKLIKKEGYNLAIKTKGFNNFMLWTEVSNMLCIEPITAYPYVGKEMLSEKLFNKSNGLDHFEVLITPF